MHSPDILGAIEVQPKKFLDGFYKGDYKQFFESFVEIASIMKKDKFLGAKNYLYLIKEMRLVAYKQFLQCYKSV